MGALSDVPNRPLHTSGAWRVLSQAEFTIGASGAVSATDSDDPAWTAANDGTGVYDITYPACPKVRLMFSLLSAAGTVTECIRTAESATAGTATIQTSKAGTAAEPASGDKITVWALGFTRG